MLSPDAMQSCKYIKIFLDQVKIIRKWEMGSNI